MIKAEVPRDGSLREVREDRDLDERAAKVSPAHDLHGPRRCSGCGCEDFLSVHSEVLPNAPVVLVQCEECGKQYSTGVLPWLPLPTLRDEITQ